VERGERVQACFRDMLVEWMNNETPTTVKPLNKGHFENNINSAVVSFVERVSSSRWFKIYQYYRETNYLGP